MKKQKYLEEKIRRVKVLMKELGYKIINEQYLEDSFTAGFDNNSGIQGGVFIDTESRFLEIVYTFSFSQTMSDFLKDRVEEMLAISYEFGCYTSIQKNDSEISFSIFTKVYYTGLNYYSLKESLRDFKRCVSALTEIIDIHNSNFSEEEDL